MTKNAEPRRNLHTHTHTHTHTGKFLPSIKQIGTICFLFLISIFPTFADNEPTLIPTPASCNNSVLNTTSGSAALEAIYTANTINTQWYTGYGENGQAASPTTCSYDGTINLPSTNPSRPGYAFNGWRLRTNSGGQQCDWSRLPGIATGCSVRDDETWWGEDFYGLYPCVYDSSLNASEFVLEYPEGVLEGDTIIEGSHCYCHVSTWTPTGGQSCVINQTLDAGVDEWQGELCEESCYTYLSGMYPATVQDWPILRPLIFRDSLANQDASIGTVWDADHVKWKPINGNSGRTMTQEGLTENSSNLNNGEWALVFSYGEVKGTSSCNNRNRCLCRATTHTPTAGQPITLVSTYYAQDAGALSNCTNDCAYTCAYKIQSDSSFRGYVFQSR